MIHAFLNLPLGWNAIKGIEHTDYLAVDIC